MQLPLLQPMLSPGVKALSPLDAGSAQPRNELARQCRIYLEELADYTRPLSKEYGFHFNTCENIRKNQRLSKQQRDQMSREKENVLRTAMLVAGSDYASADALLLRIILIMLNESKCPNKSWRRRMRRISIRTGLISTSVTSNTLHETAIYIAFEKAFVPSASTCVADLQQSKFKSNEAIHHNCDIVIKSMQQRFVFLKLAKYILHQKSDEAQRLISNLGIEMTNQRIVGLTTVLADISRQVQLSITQARRAGKTSTKFLNWISRQKWLRRFLSWLVAKIQGIRSKAPNLDYARKGALPDERFQAILVQDLISTTEARVFCSTALKTFSTLMKDVLTRHFRSVLRAIESSSRNRESLATNSNPSSSRHNAASMKEDQDTSPEPQLVQLKSADFNVLPYKNKSVGSTKRGSGLPRLLSFKDPALKTPPKNFVSECTAAKHYFERTRNDVSVLSRQHMNSSFAQNEDKEKKISSRKSKLRPCAIGGAILVSIVAFSYGGPIAFVVIVIVGLLLGAIFYATSFVKHILEEKKESEVHMEDDSTQ